MYFTNINRMWRNDSFDIMISIYCFTKRNKHADQLAQASYVPYSPHTEVKEKWQNQHSLSKSTTSGRHGSLLLKAASGLWSRTGGRNKIAAHTAGNKEWLYRAEINCIIERRSWPLMAAGIKEDFVSSILRTEAWRNERWVRIFNPTVTSLST